MKILQIHNFYQLSGGEDIVVANEQKMLKENGNEVVFYKRKNIEINDFSFWYKLKLIWETSWSNKTYFDISRIIKDEKPDICHIHNIFPLITPSIYYACSDNKIPVVQTIHNYRFFCVNGFFFRNNNICEECLNQSAYHAIKYNCYRDSKIQTYSAARMLQKHKMKNTWTDKIDVLICPSKFVYNKFIEAGFSLNKLFLKPNFLLRDPLPVYNTGNYFIYIGRLDYLKGVNTLASVAASCSSKIKMVGDGPEYDKLSKNKNIEILHKKPHEEIINYIKNCIALVFPSILYETFGLSIIEAFACGKPVIASRLGTMKELIEDGKTGLLFEPGNSDDLKSKIIWAVEHREQMKEMGKNARKEFEKKYTAGNKL